MLQALWHVKQAGKVMTSVLTRIWSALTAKDFIGTILGTTLSLQWQLLVRKNSCRDGGKTV